MQKGRALKEKISKGSKREREKTPANADLGKHPGYQAHFAFVRRVLYYINWRFVSTLLN